MRTADKLLGDVDDQREQFADAVRALLGEIFEAGADFVGNPSGFSDEILGEATDQLLESLATAIIEPLRTRLARVIDDSSDVSQDRTELVDRLRSTYREVRNDRLGELAGDLATLAFNAGILRAMVPGDRLCWMVDNGGVACPDAEDNHLAGEVVAGDEYPTGDRLPPAHPGCRCLLVPPTR